MIFPANVDNEEEREILALEGEDKKQSMTTKQILLAFLLIFGNVFISIAFSIIATFLPKTILTGVEEILDEVQAGFRKGVDQGVNLRILIEKHGNHQLPVYHNFIDFRKAFDRASEINVSDTQIGFIFSVFGLSTLILSPLIGKIVSLILVFFYRFMDKVTSPSPFVGICIALRIFSGIGYVFYKGATYNTFSQNFPHNIATLMGLNAAAFGIGVSLGPFIGGALYDFGGFCVPFFVMSGIIGLLFLSMFVFFPKLDFKFDKNAVELIEDDRHFLSMYFTKELYYPLACIITMQMTIGYFDLALGSHAMKAFGFTPTLAGTMFIGYQVVYVIICPIVGRIVDKTDFGINYIFILSCNRLCQQCLFWDRFLSIFCAICFQQVGCCGSPFFPVFTLKKKCMVIGNFLLMMVCVFIGPAPFLHIPETIWLTAVCLALVAITQAMSYIPSYKVLHRIALENGFPDNIHTTSKVSGIYLSAMGMGLFGGPSIGGIIIDHYSYGWACTIIGFCCGLSTNEKQLNSHQYFTDAVVDPVHDAMFYCQLTFIYSENLKDEDKKQSMTSKQFVLAFLLIFGNVFISIGFSIIATFLPKTASEIKVSETQIGFIFSVFGLSTLMLSPLIGKIVIITKQFNLNHRFMDKVTLPGLFVGICIVLRIFSGIGYVFYKGATYNTFFQNFPNNIATLMGLNAAAYGIGVSLGPFIGGALYDFGGFCVPFFVMSGIIGLLFISMFVLFPKLDFIFNKNVLEDDHHFLSMYFTTELYYPLACIVSMQMTIGYFDLALGSHAIKAFGFTPTLAGTMYIGYQVVYVISCPIVGRIVDETHTEKKCMVIGSLLLMTVCILIGPAPFLHIPETLWLTEVCLALVAITQAMSYIPSYKVLHKIALENGFPDNIHTTSKVSGIYLTAMGMGLFGGPSIGGIIIDHYSYGWACTIIGFCCGLSVSEKLYLSSGK
ncbi:MFS-type transporter SLC18B1 [Nymphon striatum]|nr:MFS-type transporter SLC18B1 [Nymphon striatum]